MSYPSLVILAGFMGTGKTAVGQALARALKYSFVDSDREIEAREVRSVQKIFETDGEAHFRKLEQETIFRLSEKDQTVLSVGGGAILNPKTFEHLNHKGKLILLTASVDEITKRLGNENERPLLKGGDRKKKIQKLMKDRESIYSKIEIQIDTTGLAIDQVVEAILKKM
ncbi:MAG: shikimate kinase [Deltaproteobacteria bacterium]|nr:shikimate kinase [Deltaproteobacteria bacterium]